MEQKQRKAKANPFGDGQTGEEETLPSPPAIDDLVKAAEMAMVEQQAAKSKAETIAELDPGSRDKEREMKRIWQEWENAGKTGFPPQVINRAKLLWANGYICHCGSETCPIGYFVLKTGAAR